MPAERDAHAPKAEQAVMAAVGMALRNGGERALRESDLDAIRAYWQRPTGADKAPSYLTDHAFYEVVRLCDEVERLRQGLWDIYAALGCDTDGDPTPRALAYPDLVALVLDAAKEFSDEVRRG